MTLTTLQDLNKLGGNGVLLLCVKLEIAGQSNIYLVNNNQNITFKGNEYLAFPFKISEISSAKGEIPQFTIDVDNTTRAVNNLMIQYDTYLKQNGIEGNKVYATLYVVNTIDLSEEVINERFELVSWDITSQWASFKLGASNPFNRVFPPRKMYNSFCGFKFKDVRCAYSGSATVCDKTITTCRSLNNSVRFGGFLGIR